MLRVINSGHQYGGRINSGTTIMNGILNSNKNFNTEPIKSKGGKMYGLDISIILVRSWQEMFTPAEHGLG